MSLHGCSLYRAIVLCMILVSTSSQQCSVDQLTIFSSNHVCRFGSLSYTCINVHSELTWATSLFIVPPFDVKVGNPTGALPMPAPGVTLTEIHNNDATCLNSTLIFTGTKENLAQINGVQLNCAYLAAPSNSMENNIIIVIPTPAGSPDLEITSSTVCDSDMEAGLQWTPPNNTGGHDVVIEHYQLTGLPQSATCSPGPCDMITDNTTTITGLQCDTIYNVSVRAISCIGSGNWSNSVEITFNCTTSSSITAIDLGVGISATFLVTAIISSLLTLLITYQCLNRTRNHKFRPRSHNDHRVSCNLNNNRAAVYGVVDDRQGQDFYE